MKKMFNINDYKTSTLLKKGVKVKNKTLTIPMIKGVCNPQALSENLVIYYVVPNYSNNVSYIQAYDLDNGYTLRTFYFNKDNPIEMEIVEEVDLKVIQKNYQEARDNINKLAYSGNIGSDPEIFVEDNKEIIPAFRFLKGKKDSKVDKTIDEGKAIYWDGFQAEFETRPNTCLAYHCDSVKYGLEETLKLAKKFNKEATLSNKTLIEAPTHILQSAEEEHVQLGCMPSFNAYNMKGKEVTNGRELIHRSAGGHIHFGPYTKLKEEQILPVVKALDKILGVACVALFQKFDNPIRREYYGLAGEYRLPPHGLEYRVLSNAWLIHPFIMHIVFDLSRKAYMMGLTGRINEWKATEEETIECINTCNVKMAQAILKRNKDLLKFLFMTSYQYTNDKQREKLYNIFYKGLQTAVKNTNDIASNWELEKNKWIPHSEAPNKTFAKAITNLINRKKVS